MTTLDVCGIHQVLVDPKFGRLLGGNRVRSWGVGVGSGAYGTARRATQRSMRAEGRARSDTPSGKRDHFSFLLPCAEKMCTFQ